MVLGAARSGLAVAKLLHEKQAKVFVSDQAEISKKRKEMQFLEDHQIDYVNVSGFCPLPGSPVYKNSEYYGIKFIDKNWNKHANLLYRFSNDDDKGLPFEYEETNRWGKTIPVQQ